MACFLKLQRHSALPPLHVAIKRVAIAPRLRVPQSTANRHPSNVRVGYFVRCPTRPRVKRAKRAETRSGEFQGDRIIRYPTSEDDAVAYDKFVSLRLRRASLRSYLPLIPYPPLLNGILSLDYTYNYTVAIATQQYNSDNYINVFNYYFIYAGCVFEI